MAKLILGSVRDKRTIWLHGLDLEVDGSCTAADLTDLHTDRVAGLGHRFVFSYIESGYDYPALLKTHDAAKHVFQHELFYVVADKRVRRRLGHVLIKHQCVIGKLFRFENCFFWCDFDKLLNGLTIRSFDSVAFLDELVYSAQFCCRNGTS